MQFSFFDKSDKLEKISSFGDPLEKLNAIVDWKIFIPILDSAIPRPKYEKGGRSPFDNLLMFKILVIKRLFNLSHDQTEYQINDRMSFMRFLDFDLGDRVPDAKTIWIYEDLLSKNETGKVLFDRFYEEISKSGYVSHAGSIVDASFIESPKRKNAIQRR